jgi:hypothetical protein
MILRHRPYTLQLRHAVGLAGSTRTSTPAMLVELEHEGVTGYGEASMPPHLGESQASVDIFLRQAAPLLAAVRDPFQTEEILPALDALAPGNAAAKAAVDIALHDWIGRSLGQPLYRLWGLNPARAPLTSFTIGIDVPEVVRAKVREAAPYRILKVKLGRDWATDQAMIETLRAETAVPLTVDANQGWRDREDALRRDAIVDGDKLVGQSARRSLRAGEALREGDVRAPVLVARNASVTLVLKSGGMTLSALGRAVRVAAIVLFEPRRWDKFRSPSMRVWLLTGPCLTGSTGNGHIDDTTICTPISGAGNA